MPQVAASHDKHSFSCVVCIKQAMAATNCCNTIPMLSAELVSSHSSGNNTHMQVKLEGRSDGLQLLPLPPCFTAMSRGLQLVASADSVWHFGNHPQCTRPGDIDPTTAAERHGCAGRLPPCI
jgi:hypothetical protein